MKLAKSSSQSWDQLWEAIKTDIRTKAGANGASTQEIDSFINAIEKGGGYAGTKFKRPQRTIEFFLQTMSEFKNKPTWFVKDTRKAWITTDTFSDWIGLSRYFDEAQQSLDNISNKINPKSPLLSIFRVLWQVTKELWSWFSGFLIYRAPKTFQKIFAQINFAGMSDGNVLISLGKIYFSMILVKNFLLPLLEGVKTFFATLISEYAFDVSDSAESTWETISNEYGKNIENLMSANPEAFNPFGGVGPLIKMFPAMYETSKNDPETAERERKAEFDKLVSEETVKNLKRKSEENKRVWDSADEKKRELIKTKNGFKEIERILRNYTNPMLKAKNPNFVPLTYDQYNKIKDSLEFIPELDPSVIDEIKATTRDELTKKLKRDVDLYHKVNDVMGYTTIKAKDGKHYKVVQRDFWLHYITPSMEEITANPNVKQTQNDLNTILDKL
jgi:hypothetical protein